jgi:hypothetical protein
MKYFISQPMAMKTAEQIRKERAGLAAEIEKGGGTVLDSVSPDFGGEGRRPVLALAKSLELLAQADVAVFMPGWKKARGARSNARSAWPTGYLSRSASKGQGSPARLTCSNSKGGESNEKFSL